MILVNNPGDEQAAYWPLKHDLDPARNCCILTSYFLNSCAI